jgi:hypothetical protein
MTESLNPERTLDGRLSRQPTALRLSRYSAQKRHGDETDCGAGLLSLTTPLLFRKPPGGTLTVEDICSGMPKGLGGGTLARSEIDAALSCAETHWNQCALPG